MGSGTRVGVSFFVRFGLKEISVEVFLTVSYSELVSTSVQPDGLCCPQ